jgi:hypothetical protein
VSESFGFIAAVREWFIAFILREIAATVKPITSASPASFYDTNEIMKSIP